MRAYAICGSLAVCIALAAGPAASVSATDLLPPGGAAGGWEQQGPVLTYVPDNLYEYIDGAADGYLVFDFKLLGHADYTHSRTADQRVSVDVYEMATPQDAFGIYSVERSPDLKFIALGDQGYVTPRSAAFHQDRFYVRLKVRQAGEEGEKAMLAMAQAVSERAPRGRGQPRMLRIFPRPSRVVYSERYLRGAVLGHAFLPRGYVADYQVGDARVRLVAIDWPNAKEAADGMSKLREYLEKGGSPIELAGSLGDVAYSAKDRYLGQLLFFRQGRLMGVVVGYQDHDWALLRAQMMLDRWRRYVP